MVAKSKKEKTTEENPYLKNGINFLRSHGLAEHYLRKIEETIKAENFNGEQIYYFIKEIYTNYKRALILPGEPVGTVAAQSIGEPGTQMSLPGDELVFISKRNNFRSIKIGDLIDK